MLDKLTEYIRKKRFLQNTALIGGIIFLIAALVSIGCISIAESSRGLQLDGEGFSTMYDLYGVPIKLLTASFGLLIGWVAIIRMEQTDNQITTAQRQYALSQSQVALSQDQLVTLTANNQFNNYYKHVEEFRAQLEGENFFIHWKDYVRPVSINIYMIVYRELYYSHPGQFAPALNDRANGKIDFLFEVLKGERFQRFSQFSEIPTEDLKELVDLFNSFSGEFKAVISNIAKVRVDDIFSHLRRKGTPEGRMERYEQILLPITIIYYCASLFIAVRTFDGTETPSPVKGFLATYNVVRSSTCS